MGTRRAALHLDLFEQPGTKRVFQHPANTVAYLVGVPFRCGVYRHLIEGHRIFRGPFVEITEADAIDGLGSAGALEIFRHRPA
jgi:hypothetical protein